MGNSFVVVKGIPSFGQDVLIGSGKLEPQPILSASVLPESSTTGDGTTGKGQGGKRQTSGSAKVGVVLGLSLVFLFLSITL
jgi:hypothetical protein